MKYYLNIDNTFNIGDKVILTTNLSNGYCLFMIGHQFKIDNIDRNYSKYYLIDNENEKLTIFDENHISKIITKKMAKKLYYDKIEYNFFIDFFYSNCPHKEKKYDNRDIYYTCIKQKKMLCRPNVNCIQYYNDINIKNERIEQYIRKIKLQKIIL